MAATGQDLMAADTSPTGHSAVRRLREFTELVQDPEALDGDLLRLLKEDAGGPGLIDCLTRMKRRIHSHQRRRRREPLAPRQGPPLRPRPQQRHRGARGNPHRSRQPASRHRQGPPHHSRRRRRRRRTRRRHTTCRHRLHDPLSPGAVLHALQHSDRQIAPIAAPSDHPLLAAVGHRHPPRPP